VIKKLILILTLLISCFPAASNSQEVRYLDDLRDESLSFSRANFGNTDLPVWYSLTEFEIRTLKNTSGRNREDPDYLLALALIASGETRNEDRFKHYQGIIQDFVSDVRPEVEEAGPGRERGRVLFREMHRGFLAAESGRDSLGNYDLEQSKFAEVLDSGSYNCISSSILYIILARHFGLNVSGVRLPTHVFVQLSTEDGSAIEIETTSPDGYDLVHDRKFYSSGAEQWSESRDLPDPTFEEYRKRLIVEPYRLITYNMINQHTSRLEPVDRLRLIEIRGYLDSASESAVLDRLKLYLMEYNHLSDMNDCLTAIRMFNTVKSSLERISGEFSGNPEIINTLSFLETNIGYCMWEAENSEGSLELIDGVLEKVYADSKFSSEIFANTSTVINNNIIELLESGNTEKSSRMIQKYEPFFHRPELAPESVAGFLRNRADLCFSRERWAKAVEYLNICRELIPGDKEYTENLNNNLLFAYFNWGVELLKLSDWEKAISRLEKALEFASDRESREKTLKNLSIAYFSLGSENNFEKGKKFIENYGNSCARFDWYIRNAVSFYSNWAGYLSRNRRWTDGIAKLNTALDLAGRSDEELTGRISDNISALYLDWGNDFFERKDFKEAATRFKKSLNLSRSDKQRGISVRNLSLASLNQAASSGAYRSGEEFISQHDPDFRQYDGYRKNVIWFYSEWADQLLQEGSWSAGIDKLKKRLDYFEKNSSDDISRTRGYIKDTYINWSFDYLENREWENSLGKLEKAMKWADSPSAREDVSKYIFNCFHKWALFHLNREEKLRALALYRRCRNEYPLCREKCLIEEERIKREL